MTRKKRKTTNITKMCTANKHSNQCHENFKRKKKNDRLKQLKIKNMKEPK